MEVRVVLGYSVVTLFKEREDAALCLSVSYILVIRAVCRQNSLFSILLGLFHQDLQLSCLIFASTTSSSSYVNYPSFVSC